MRHQCTTQTGSWAWLSHNNGALWKKEMNNWISPIGKHMECCQAMLQFFYVTNTTAYHLCRNCCSSPSTKSSLPWPSRVPSSVGTWNYKMVLWQYLYRRVSNRLKMIKYSVLHFYSKEKEEGEELPMSAIRGATRLRRGAKARKGRKSKGAGLTQGPMLSNF